MKAPKAPIEWIEVWNSKNLRVTEIKRNDRSIYVLSNPLADNQAISIEGKDLLAFARSLLSEEE